MVEKTGTFKVEEIDKKPIASIPEASVGEYAGFDWAKVPYKYKVFADRSEYSQVYSEQDLLDLVNGTEKANAKAKEYQRVTKPFRPDPNTPEAKREQMISDLVKRFGVNRQQAETTIDALIASGNAPA